MRGAIPATGHVPLRTYLIIGGDEHERGVVAGNVARAAGTVYRQIKLDDAAAPGHRCAALTALKQALAAPAFAHSVALVDTADVLFAGSSTGAACAGCDAIDEGAPAEFLRKTGGTFLFAVDTHPALVAWGGWRPDVVVYLARAGVTPVGNVGSARLHVRVGSAAVRASAR